MSASLEQLKQAANNIHELTWGIQNRQFIMGQISGKEIKAVVWYQWVLFAVYKVHDFFSSKKVEFHSLQAALANTDKLFSEAIAAQKEHFPVYQTLIHKKWKKENLDEAEEKKLKDYQEELKSWNTHMAPRLKSITKAIGEAVIQLYDRTIQLPHTPFVDQIDQALQRQMDRYQRIINLEALTSLESQNQPKISLLPSTLALFKLCAGEKLSAEDEAVLEEWIERINKKGLSLKIRTFDRMLKSLVAVHFPDAQPNHRARALGELEWELQKRGCEIFNQIDPVQIGIRTMREPFVILKDAALKEHKLILGAPLPTKKAPNHDRHVIYTLRDDPDKLVEVGFNTTTIRLKWIDAAKSLEKRELIIPMNELVDIDIEGRCAVVKRLKKPLNSYQWTTNSEVITEADEKLAAPLLAVLKMMKDQQITSDHFSLDYLMLNEAGELTATKPLKGIKAKPEDYLKLIRIIEACCVNNLHIFKLFIDRLELQEHKFAKFFHEVVKLAFQSPQFTVEAIANQSNPPILFPDIVQHAIDLKRQVLEVRRNCLARLRAELGQDKIDEVALSAAVEGSIFEIYSKMGFFLKSEKVPTIEADVLAHVSKQKPKAIVQDE